MRGTEADSKVMTPERPSAPVVNEVGRNGCLIGKRNEVEARETFVAGFKREKRGSGPRKRRGGVSATLGATNPKTM